MPCNRIRGDSNNNSGAFGLYAAIGLGMSMIFGIVRITNLAHGDLLILAAYLSLIFMGSQSIRQINKQFSRRGNMSAAVSVVPGRGLGIGRFRVSCAAQNAE